MNTTRTPGADGPARHTPARSDAIRNRTRILNAAEAAFAEVGLGVPVDEIARRAEVGPGTVYRNFSTKEALFEAVILRHLDTLVSEARELAASDRPGVTLFAFLQHLGVEARRRRNLVEALLGAGAHLDVAVAEVKRELQHAVDVLLVRAQDAGEVRDDVTIDDLFGMVMGCAMSTPGADPASQSRMLSILCEGLRVEPRSVTT